MFHYSSYFKIIEKFNEKLGGGMLGFGAFLFMCGVLAHCMCTTTDKAAEQCNDIVPIEQVKIFSRKLLKF